MDDKEWLAERFEEHRPQLRARAADPARGPARAQDPVTIPAERTIHPVASKAYIYEGQVRYLEVGVRNGQDSD
jgi:hypothetical protein